MHRVERQHNITLLLLLDQRQCRLDSILSLTVNKQEGMNLIGHEIIVLIVKYNCYESIWKAESVIVHLVFPVVRCFNIVLYHQLAFMPTAPSVDDYNSTLFTQ